MSLFVESKIPLRGILLTVHCALGGDQLVFRYPQVQRKTITSETLNAVFGKKSSSQTAGDVKLADPPANPSQPPIALVMTEYSPYTMPSVMVCSILSPKLPLCDRIFEMVIDDYRFIGRPTLITSPSSSIPSTTNLEAPKDKTKDELTMFNLVFVLGKHPLDERQADMCRRIVSHLAAALLHEQNRCGYLNTEVFKMLQLRERWLLQYQKANEAERRDHTHLTYDLIQASSLASLIKDIFHGLRDEGYVHVRLNGWITLSLTIKDIEDHPSRPIRPYQTLLIYDPASCLAALPEDASIHLRRLIQAATPTKSFRELQYELGIPLAQLYRMAAHLCYWGKARIIDTLTKNNVYILNPKSGPDEYYLPYLSQKFEQIFPIKLTTLLQRFSFPKKLGQHVHFLPSSHHKDFVEMVIWLLRHELIVQVQTYIYLITPSSPPYYEDNVESDPINVNSSPKPLHQSELEFLSQFDNQSSEFNLFKRLCPYFRGQHHLTEIAWRENLSKEEVNKVIQMYKSLLVIMEHPED